MICAGLTLIVVTGQQLLLWSETGIWRLAPISALLPSSDIDSAALAGIQAIAEQVLQLSAMYVSLFIVALLFWLREEMHLARSRRIGVLRAKRAPRRMRQGPRQAVTFQQSSSAARTALILASCVVFAVSIAMAGKTTATSDERCCSPDNPVTNSNAAPRVG